MSSFFTKGEAFTLINPKDLPKLARIERLIEIERLSVPGELGIAPEMKQVGQSDVKKRKKKPFFKKKNKPNQSV